MTTEIAAIWTAWDAACLHFTRALFVKLGFTELLLPPAEPVADLPFVASPAVLVTSILVYLLVICSSLILSAFSRTETKRDNVAIRGFVQVHNVFLVSLSAYMFTGIIYQAIRNGYSFWGNEYNPSEKGMATMIYIFYVSKIYEFMDTFIMVLKGNMRQVSFLHVYHHGTISIIWPGCHCSRRLARRDSGACMHAAYYSAALNSLVHVVMYVYYLLASAIGKDEQKRRKYLWWGKYLTMFQMTQFVTMMVQATYCVVTGTYNQFLARLLFFYMLSLLVLFGQFYIHKYSRGAAGGGKRRNGHANASTNAVDGVRNGATNGARNGARNGVTNGVANGMSNGASNGNGVHMNGHANGKSKAV